jgi:hypothetical protein
LKDGDRFCLSKQMEVLIPIVNATSNGRAPNTSAISDPSFICSKCIRNQINLYAEVLKKLPKELVATIGSVDGAIKSMNEGIKGKCGNSGASSLVSFGSLAAVFILSSMLF